ESRCVDAARMAIESPLLEMSIDGAVGVLYNIIGGQDLSLTEITEAAEVIRQAADDDAEIIFGATTDDAMGRDVQITLIATGFQGGAAQRRPGRPERRFRAQPESAGNAQPGQAAPSRIPVAPDDEWSEPAILRFLRER
ncbi:MAG TPA: cell division protein FtsZ, partial [Nitrolancea sp.]